MAGKFVNTKHSETINTLVDGLQDILKNPYYMWSDKHGTITTYYNRNIEKSTLDEGAKIEQSSYGHDSPIVYNKINEFYIYGIERIQVSIEKDEFGASSADITGEGIVLPNTIVPYPGDYFAINYTKENVMFKVTGVTHDTLETGANIYKFTYELCSIDESDLHINLGDTYQMMINNVGTSFNPIIRSEKYDFIKELDSVRSYLREHFVAVFYSDRIQSFSFYFNMRRFYDPYMVEFIRNTDLLKDIDNYIYVTQQLSLPSKFILDYKRSIFRCFETRDFKNIRRYSHNAIGRFITSKTDIFSNRPEDYWSVDFKYTQLEGEVWGVIPCFAEELFTGIEEKIIYTNEYSIYNIIIKYINGIDLDNDDIESLKFMEYADNPTLFYALPLIIFCLDDIITRMMVKSDN